MFFISHPTNHSLYYTPLHRVHDPPPPPQTQQSSVSNARQFCQGVTSPSFERTGRCMRETDGKSIIAGTCAARDAFGAGHARGSITRRRRDLHTRAVGRKYRRSFREGPGTFERRRPAVFRRPARHTSHIHVGYGTELLGSPCRRVALDRRGLRAGGLAYAPPARELRSVDEPDWIGSGVRLIWGGWWDGRDRLC